MTYVVHEDDSVTIHNFESQDNDGYMFAGQLPTLESIKENDDRVAQEVTIDGKTYTVRNKAGIFTYKQPL